MEDNRKDFDILNKIKRLPGGLVIVPLVLAVVIAIFFPQTFQIGEYVTVLSYDGNSAMMGLFLIVCGSAINTRQIDMPLYKGVTPIGIKLLLGAVAGLLVGKLRRSVGMLGLIPFVSTAVITNPNGSLHILLSSQFGNTTDMGAISILSLNDSSFFTLVALGATGLASIPFKVLVATLIPLLIGLIRGNTDKGSRSACATAQSTVTFFVIISIGSKTDVSTLVTAGASGIMLGLISTATAVVFSFVFNFLLSKKEHNAMGATVDTIALNSAMTLAAVAWVGPPMEPYVGMVIAQRAAVSIITLFLCSSITVFFDGWMRKNKRGIHPPEGWATGKA